MGGGKKNKSKKKSKPKTKAQKMAVANKKKYGGTASAAKANKAANKASKKTTGIGPVASGKAYAKAVNTAKNQPKKKTSGIGPVASGSDYAKSLSTAKNQPTKKTSGVGPVADGAKYAAALKASPPKLKDGTKVAGKYTGSFSNRQLLPDGSYGFPKVGDVINTGGKSGKDFKYDGKNWNAVPVNTAFNPFNKLRNDPNVDIPAGGGNTIPSATKRELQIHNFERQLEGLPPVNKLPDQSSIGSTSDSLAAVGNLGGLGIGTGTPSYFSIKSPESFGAPSQAEVDAAAGITAGGLNIGGSGFTPSNPSGGTTSRAIKDMTSEQLADRYDASLNPNSFKGLSDGVTFGVGPVASGDAYARGLNTDNKNVENRLRQVRNLGSTLTGGLIPSVRKLTDKEIADRRIKNAAFRQANLVGRNRGGGGARLPVAPLTPEEILLPEETAVAQTGPAYQQAQTGIDPNRLMQIQQDAYLQAFNPTFNPMFRFFDRRRPRGGAFRRAFRRD